MSRKRLGIIGCGAVVQNNYARAIPEVRGVEVAAVHDLDPRAASAAAALLGAPAVSLEELFGRVDAVIVATPPSTHVGIVTDCIKRGLTVLCEKPFVSREADALELVRMSKDTGVPVYVGHLRRTFPSARLARDLIATGTLGRVRSMSLVEGGRFSWDTSSNYVSSDISGGVLFDTGSHTVDLGLFVSGLDGRDFAVAVDEVHRDRPEPAHELSARARLITAETEIALGLHLSRHRVLANRVRIELDHGIVELSVGPRDRIRVTGRGGSAVIPAGTGAADFNGYFTEQFYRIFVEKSAAEFEAARFVGLSRVLERVATAREAR